MKGLLKQEVIKGTSNDDMAITYEDLGYDN